MNRIPRHWRAQVRLEGLPVDHVNWSIEQTGNVIFQSDVVEKRDMSLGIDINEDVEIAVSPALAARDRPEYRGMRDAARPQRAFMAAQGGKGILSIHTQTIHNQPAASELRTCGATDIAQQMILWFVLPMRSP